MVFEEIYFSLTANLSILDFPLPAEVDSGELRIFPRLMTLTSRGVYSPTHSMKQLWAVVAGLSLYKTTLTMTDGTLDDPGITWAWMNNLDSEPSLTDDR